MVESGLVQHWMKQHLRHEDKCSGLRSVGRFRSTLDNTVGAYFVLVAGLLFALIVFIAEIIAEKALSLKKTFFIGKSNEMLVKHYFRENMFGE